MFVRIGQNQLLHNICRTKITVLIRYPKRYIQQIHERLENYLIIKEEQTEVIQEQMLTKAAKWGYLILSLGYSSSAHIIPFDQQWLEAASFISQTASTSSISIAQFRSPRKVISLCFVLMTLIYLLEGSVFRPNVKPLFLHRKHNLKMSLIFLENNLYGQMDTTHP